MALFGLATLLFMGGIVVGIIERIRGTPADTSEMLGGFGMFAAIAGIPAAFLFDAVVLTNVVSPIVFFVAWLVASPNDPGTDTNAGTETASADRRADTGVATGSKEAAGAGAGGPTAHGGFETVERTGGGSKTSGSSPDTGASVGTHGTDTKATGTSDTDTEVFDPATESTTEVFDGAVADPGEEEDTEVFSRDTES